MPLTNSAMPLEDTAATLYDSIEYGARRSIGIA
jgi:hypothetical protein